MQHSLLRQSQRREAAAGVVLGDEAQADQVRFDNFFNRLHRQAHVRGDESQPHRSTACLAENIEILLLNRPEAVGVDLLDVESHVEVGAFDGCRTLRPRAAAGTLQ